jgi:hypothetical protein
MGRHASNDLPRESATHHLVKPNSFFLLSRLLKPPMPAQPRTWGTGPLFPIFVSRRPSPILPRSRSVSVSRTTPRPGMAVQRGSISTISTRALPRALIEQPSPFRGMNRRIGDATPARLNDADGARDTMWTSAEVRRPYCADSAALFRAAQKSRDEFEILGPIMAPSENAVPEMLRRYQWVTEPRAGLCDWRPVLRSRSSCGGVENSRS